MRRVMHRVDVPCAPVSCQLRFKYVATGRCLVPVGAKLAVFTVLTLLALRRGLCGSVTRYGGGSSMYLRVCVCVCV